MPNRWTKKLPLLALSAALLLTCCACAAQAEEEKGETAAKTAGTEAYSLTLPATITAKEQENNTLTLFLDGTEVGGVAVIAYENAAALDLDSLGDGHAEKELNQILQLVAPEGHVDHMFESYGEDGYLSLSLVPWPDRDEPETIHYLFPKGDAFYDLFFQICQQYHVDWATATEQEKAFVEEVARTAWEKHQEKATGIKRNIRPAFSV